MKMTYLVHVKRPSALVKLSKTRTSDLIHVLRKIANRIFQSKLRESKPHFQIIFSLCMNVLREKGGDLENVSKEKLMEGKIIGCLKEHFVILQQSPEGDHDPSKFLSKKCATHIEKIMSEEAEDFELDPELMKSCGGTSLSPLSEDGMCSRKKHTDPIECLKQHFMDENLKGEHLTECRKYVALLIKEPQV